ncbi:MAG: gamma-butyrobetaine hydroxylase-like domain-containing protein [Edaphobacter sp.]
MSHEGIRIVDAKEARKEDTQHERLPAEAVTPKKVRVKKTEGTGVEIDWKDDHKSTWSFVWLRNACPCATCHEDREKTGRLPGVAKPKEQTLLTMYEAPVKLLDAIPVGKYALKFKWSDGHESGIYSWEYLRRMCQCALCKG